MITIVLIRSFFPLLGSNLSGIIGVTSVRSQKRFCFRVRQRGGNQPAEPGLEPRPRPGPSPRPIPPAPPHLHWAEGEKAGGPQQSRAPCGVEQNVSEIPLTLGAALYLKTGDEVLDHHHRQPVGHLVSEAHRSVHEG